MLELLTKLDLMDQRVVHVLDAPKRFEDALIPLKGIAIERAVEEHSTIAFALAFVTTQADIDRLTAQIIPAAVGDASVWFLYPRPTSRWLQSTFDPIVAWQPIMAAGFEGVRIVYIDNDWAAIRFRHSRYLRPGHLAPGPETTATPRG